MGRLTEHLNLFQYDVQIDGNENFSIEKALNENWAKIDKAFRELPCIYVSTEQPDDMRSGDFWYKVILEAVYMHTLQTAPDSGTDGYKIKTDTATEDITDNKITFTEV